MSVDFRDFIAAFNAADVRYLVVGAHALAAFGAPLDALKLGQRDFSTPGVVVQLGLPPCRIDVLTSITGVDFGQAWAARMSGEMLGIPVSFIGRAELIANKRAVGRAKDLADVRALTQEP